jgi:hypothetical protein
MEKEVDLTLAWSGETPTRRRPFPLPKKWAAEHPAKTRQSEFLKHYPDAQIDSGCLNACPMDIFGDMGINCNKQTCYECKKEFWLTEVKL